MKATKRTRLGGRQKGTPNKVTLGLRERIEREADPIGFLVGVMKGKPVTISPKSGATPAETVYPSLGHRMDAAATLARKIMPDAKSPRVMVSLPTIKTAEDIERAFDAVLAAVGRGDITLDEMTALTNMLEGRRKAMETSEVVAKLQPLLAAAKMRGDIP